MITRINCNDKIQVIISKLYKDTTKNFKPIMDFMLMNQWHCLYSSNKEFQKIKFKIRLYNHILGINENS